jgi:quercetin dioxygenase-like cupin family protein
MPRPHVEFVHAQQLAWRDVPFAGPAWPGVQGKVLSRDASSSACSVLLRFPRGWRCGPHALAAQQELFVLDGELRIGSIRYGLDDYACLPAGYPRAEQSSEDGAVLLAFFDADPVELTDVPDRAGDASGTGRRAGAADWDRTELIERIDTHNTLWTRHDIDPSVQFLNLSHKVLRHRADSGEKTILLSSGAQTHPQDWREAQLAHDCVEEMYLLGGDIVGERGTMYEGAYFWRPPGVWHGPFGSRRGSLSLIRFCEGRHANRWGPHALPFSLTPAHDVELPADLGAVDGPWEPTRF